MDRSEITPKLLGAAIMQYTREAPGKVYLDNIQEFTAVRFGKEYAESIRTAEDIERLLSADNADSGPFLTVDETGAVYTIPGKRQILDPLIHASCPDYCYNRCLYEEVLPAEGLQGITLEELAAQGAVQLDNDSFTIDIDLGRVRPSPSGEILVGDFSLEKLIRLAMEASASRVSSTEPWSITSLRAPNVIFLGDVFLSFQQEIGTTPVFLNGMDFSGSVFARRLSVQNLYFRFASGETRLDGQRIDFRNARFFSGAMFRDIIMTGDMRDMEISFEDARFNGSLSFYGVDFGHAALNCFQTVLGPYLIPGKRLETADLDPEDHVLTLKNCSFSGDTELNCEDMQIASGKIVLDHISNLPLARLSPDVSMVNGSSSCTNCTLEILHTVIYQPVLLSNFNRIRFEDITNYGHIVAGTDWAALSTEGWALPRSLAKRKKPLHRFLLAIYAWGYNSEQRLRFSAELCKEKEKIFNMLRLDFCEQGKYEEEDQALLLYMYFKPYTDRLPIRQKGKKLLYGALYSLGDYGLNPGKIIRSYFLIALIFSLLYFIGLTAVGNFFSFAAFSSPQDGTLWPTVLYNIWISVLYSLECVSPFPAQCDVSNALCAVLAALESFAGVFVLGYFSFAIIKRTLRN